MFSHEKVVFPQWRVEEFSIPRAKLAITLVCLGSAVTCTPAYVRLGVQEHPHENDCFNWTVLQYWNFMDIRYSSIVNNVIPCLLLIYVSIR